MYNVGQQRTGADVDDGLHTADLGLDGVSSRDELAEALRKVHVRADKPSLRTLEAKTRHSVTPLSKTALAEMLKGVRLPRKATMVSFLRACGVQDDAMEIWQRTWERVASGKEGRHSRRVANSWHFADSGPVTLICAQLPTEERSHLADPADPNYTEFLSYADLDALIDLHGHIRAVNPDLDVFIKLSSEFVSGDLSGGHVVLLGGIAWNDLTNRILEMSRLPIRQIEDPAIVTGEIFVVGVDGKEERFMPKWTTDHGKFIEDVGMIARTPNPLNLDRSLTICNGIHSRGVLGAVKTLTDTKLRESNEIYIAETFANPSIFAILMRVQVIEGRTITPNLRDANCVLYKWPPDPGDVQS
jgi:hypothetical protein